MEEDEIISKRNLKRVSLSCDNSNSARLGLIRKDIPMNLISMKVSNRIFTSKALVSDVSMKSTKSVFGPDSFEFKMNTKLRIKFLIIALFLPLLIIFIILYDLNQSERNSFIKRILGKKFKRKVGFKVAIGIAINTSFTCIFNSIIFLLVQTETIVLYTSFKVELMILSFYGTVCLIAFICRFWNLNTYKTLWILDDKKFGMIEIRKALSYNALLSNFKMKFFQLSPYYDNRTVKFGKAGDFEEGETIFAKILNESQSQFHRTQAPKECVFNFFVSFFAILKSLIIPIYKYNSPSTPQAYLDNYNKFDLIFGISLIFQAFVFWGIIVRLGFLSCDVKLKFRSLKIVRNFISAIFRNKTSGVSHLNIFNHNSLTSWNEARKALFLFRKELSYHVDMFYVFISLYGIFTFGILFFLAFSSSNFFDHGIVDVFIVLSLDLSATLLMICDRIRSQSSCNSQLEKMVEDLLKLKLLYEMIIGQLDDLNLKWENMIENEDSTEIPEDQTTKAEFNDLDYQFFNLMNEVNGDKSKIIPHLNRLKDGVQVIIESIQYDSGNKGIKVLGIFRANPSLFKAIISISISGFGILLVQVFRNFQIYSF